jgi:hypothetical protein
MEKEIKLLNLTFSKYWSSSSMQLLLKIINDANDEMVLIILLGYCQYESENLYHPPICYNRYITGTKSNRECKHLLVKGLKHRQVSL